MANLFDELKHKVSIEQVAASLGYRVNRAAGIHGRYLEMQLPDGHGSKSDTIVIRKGNSRGWDTYFHRQGGGGTVVDFVRENISQLCHTADRESWKAVLEVLSKYADLPLPSAADSQSITEWKEHAPQRFVPDRYLREAVADNLPAARAIYSQRGLSDDTVSLFAPWIELVRDNHSSFRHPCLGFPYREPGQAATVGYELRGYGTFKGKATGSNSTTAAWIVDMSGHGNPLDVRHVYFAESAYDIMAFYQHNRFTLKPETSVFVSVGGQLSNQQVTGLMKYYSRAQAVDCFDNDMAGQIYGIRMAALVSGICLDLVRTADSLRLTANGKTFTLTAPDVTLAAFGRQVALSPRVGQQKPPANYKDWNDVVMGRPLKEENLPTKYQRDEHLRQRRTGQMKR